MKTDSKRKEAYLSPELETIEALTSEVIAASGLEEGQIEDVDFETWNLN